MAIKIDTVSFPSDDSEGDQIASAKLAGRAAKKRKQLAKALTTAVGTEAIQAAQHSFVGSAYVRLAAMIEAAKDLPYGERKTIPEYLQLASDLNPWEPSSELVRLRAKTKPGGGHRFYFEFGIKNKTAQIIAADMLRPLFQPAPFQYDVAGKGVPHAISSARKFIEKGYRYALHLDIKKYFDSFSHEAILGPAISMTKDFKSAVLTGKHYKVKYASTSVPMDVLAQYRLRIASAGIPQGSSVSPLVAAFFMSKLDLGKLPEDVVVVNYVDDFLLLAKAASSLDVGSHALQSALTDLSAGDFTLDVKLDHTQADFTFLGHDIGIDAAGAVSVTINELALNRFVDRYHERAKRLQPSLSKKVASASPGEHGTMAANFIELIYWVKSWALAYKMADDIEEHLDFFRIDLEGIADDWGISNFDHLWSVAKPNNAMRYPFHYLSS